MMDAPRPWMDEELSQVRDSARKFFARECVPHELRWREQHHAPRDIWTRAGTAGLLCASIPDAYGGGGGNFLHEAVICEEQMYSMSQAFSNNVHSGIVAHYILAYGSEAQKKRWLPKLATGETVAAIAMSEPGAGTDLQRIKSHAKLEGDPGSGPGAGHWRLNGNKTFITNGMHANLVVVAVKTGAEAGAKGISLLVVETDGCEGFRRGPLLDKLGQKTLDTCELFFDDVKVPATNLLGTETGKGFVQLMQQLPRERMLIAVGAVAMMRRAIDDTLNYVRERNVFGQPLMAMQNTRFKLAECETQARAAQAFVDDCIAKLMKGELDVPTAAMAKWWTTDTLCRIVDECLQLHGGYGFMNEYPIARLYADVRVTKIFGGANEVMKEIIARDMEKR